MRKFLFLTYCLLFISISVFGQKITLTPSMLSYYQGQGNQHINLASLVDEQSIFTNPLTDNSGTPKPTSVYIPSWGTVPKIQIDLGSSYTLNQVAFFDSWNAPALTIKYDNNGTWTTLFTGTMSYSEKWKAVGANVTTSKLLFEYGGLNGHTGEIAVFGTATDGGTCTPAKLVVSPSQVTKENGGGDAGALVNEQTAAGDPQGGTGGAPSDTWFPGWTANDVTVSAYIDFGSSKKISAVYLRDVEDNGAFTVSSGSPGNWTPLFTDNLTGWQSWNAHNVDVTTRYLRFTRQTRSSNVSEVVIYGCSSGPVDSTPPSAISNLNSGTKTSNSIQLTWSAPGDDGSTGTATGYDVRYSTSAITAANFNNATAATGEPIPAVAGTAQTFTVSGLASSTTYHFAIKTSDEVPNVSLISNVISATTNQVVIPTSINTVDKFMGTNAFVDDPIDKMLAVGNIREYHNWNWDEGDIWSGNQTPYQGYPNNHIRWAPSIAGGGWNFDQYYTNVTQAGLSISPVIQGTVMWLHGGMSFPGQNKPIDEPGASTTNPASYEKKAHHMFQFAARYGATTVADNKLTLAPGHSRLSGLGLIKYLEDWNEQDKWWEGPDAEFSPQEYAAMASANYDGHAKTMTMGSGTFGVKNADPTMKFVMGGLAEISIDYISQMKAWFQANRTDGKFAADVLNFHHYSWKTASGPAGGGPAISPEADNLRGRLQAVVDYRNANLPGVEIWLSEFGYDTSPTSPLRVPQIGSNDAQETQGQWIVRGYLALVAAGIDRAQMFMLRDTGNDPNNPVQFGTSGLVGPKGDWTPKKSWYYTYTMKTALTNTKFLGEVASSDPNILIYKFKDVNSSAGVYAVWAKTSTDYKVNGFSVTLTGTPTSATLVQMAPGDNDGVSSTLAISAGKVSLNVSERPIFIKVNNIQ